ncbi:MAG: hypothetical protein ABII64_08470 [Elusimicrobiota bacterium]
MCRLLLALLVLGQACSVPVYSSAPVAVRIVPNYANPPGVLTGIVTVPDYSAPEDKGKIKLQWRAPAAEQNTDDVFSYIIKYATFSVSDVGSNTNTWWNHPNCLTVLDPELPNSWGYKAHSARGTIETVNISELIGGVRYYFGVKSVDRYKRASDYDDPMAGITNQTQGFTTTPPWTPYNITTITALATTKRGQANLEWTAPVFIDTSGFLVSGNIPHSGEYCVQYSTTHELTSGETILDTELYKLYLPDNTNNWVGSTRVTISTYNVTSGDQQRILLTGLTKPTTYFFHIFTKNDWPNRWSNASFTAQVMPYWYFKPVQTVTAIASGSTDTNIGSYASLTWTNPATEPELVGTRVCYSNSTYPSSYAWPTYIDLQPQLTAQTTDYQHIQLLPRTSYYYTLYAYDTDGYYSAGISTMVYTGTDLIAPDLVQNLTGLIGVDISGGVDRYFITLNWTTPDSAPLYRNSDYQGARLYFSTITTVISQHEYANTFGGTNSLPQQFLHDNLQPLTTYYYSMESYDLAGNSSTVRSAALLYISEEYVAPSRPTLLSAVTASVTSRETGNTLYLRWTSPPEPQTSGMRVVLRTDRFARYYSDIQEYTLVHNWAGGANTTADYTYKQLLSNTTYYTSLFAISKYGVASRSTTTYIYITVPWVDTVAPYAPQNIKIASRTSNTRTIEWRHVTRNADYAQFSNPDAPRIDELLAYKVFRSTGIMSNDWYSVGTVMAGINSYTDTLPDNRMYFYKVRAIDATGNYNDSTLLSSEGDLIFVNIDGSYLWLSEALSRALDKDYNTYKYDLTVKFNSNASDELGPVLKSLEWDAYKIIDSSAGANLSKVDGFSPSKALGATPESADLGLTYAVGSSNSAISFSPAAKKLTPEQAAKQVSMYYFNGVEWLKLSGTVNAEYGTVNSKVKFAGKYQLRMAAPATEFTFYGVLPKIITPNNDGQNDKALFRFANPKESVISVRIFDVKGALVRKLDDTNRTSDSQEGAGFISWDGTDKDGMTVMPGVYIYQFEGEGKVINGTVVVAR